MCLQDKWKYYWKSLVLQDKCNIEIYQLPLIFNCIVAHCLIKRCLSQGTCLYQVMKTLHFLNDFAKWCCINKKIKNYVIIPGLKSQTIGKLINRIPGLRLLISSLPGSALRRLVKSLSKPCDVNKRSQSLDMPWSVDITTESLIQWLILSFSLFLVCAL